MKVGCAQASVDDGQHDQNKGDDGEERERSPCREIFLEEVGLVHSDELE